MVARSDECLDHGGNRERDLRTGFTSPPKLTLSSLFSFATKPMWGINYLTKGKFELPHLQDFVKEGTSSNSSIGNYFSTMLDQSMNWKDAEQLCSKWGGHFALKGVMILVIAAVYTIVTSQGSIVQYSHVNGG